MDVSFDPVNWIIGGVAAYVAFAILFIAGTWARHYFFKLYLGKPPGRSYVAQGESGKDIYREPRPEAFQQPPTLPRPAGTESEATSKSAVYCPACEARIPAAGAYCQWCGSGDKTISVEPATSAAFQPPNETSSAQPREMSFQQTTESRQRQSALSTEPLPVAVADALESITPVAYDKAPLGRRYAALLVDTFIAAGPALSGMGCVFLPMSIAGMLDRYRALALAVVPLMLVGYVLMLVGLIWCLIYLFLKDGWRNGRSFGKRLCGLMVVDVTDNKPCTKAQSAVRTIGLFLPFTQALDPALIWQDPQGRRVGDHLAGTQVIVASDYDPTIHNRGLR